MSIESKQNLYNFLCSLPNVDVKHDYWVSTQCVLCGDSKKDPNKKRLYILCDPTRPEDPVVFNCFNCFETGVVSRKMISDIASGIKMTIDPTKLLMESNKDAKKDDGTIKRLVKGVSKPLSYTLPPMTMRPSSIRKYQYLVNRIGYQIPIEDFERLKVVWNISDYAEANNIRLPKTSISLETMNECYIGFLSTMNNAIILRDITNTQRFRWFKYYLVKPNDALGNQCYYNVKNQIDIFSRDPIRIIIAEGIVDTLSVLYNFYGGVQGNNVFVSTCNGTFEPCLMTYFLKGLVGENIHVEIYLDNDTRYRCFDMREHILPFVGNMKTNISFYRNRIKKDFGYAISDIDREEVILTKNLRLEEDTYGRK